MNAVITDNTVIKNEQEAAVAILLSCINQQHPSQQKRRLEHVSMMLLHTSKFQDYSLTDLAGIAMPLISKYGNDEVVQYCAPLVSENFRETLFSMVCEISTGDGELSPSDSEVVGVAALYLGVSIDMMRVMISTFLIRNRWNIQ